MAKIPIGNVKGVGIKEITFTSSTGGELPGIAGATDTYTITYTDDTTDTYEVYNGKDGADGAQIDDATISDKTGWSSSKIDAAKVSATKSISMVKLGFAASDTVDIVDFLSALVKTYGAFGHGDIAWSSSEMGKVTDGTTTVEIIGGLFSFSASSNFPSAAWSYAEAVYYPIEGSNLGSAYKIFARVGATAGTVEVAKIYTYGALEETINFASPLLTVSEESGVVEYTTTAKTMFVCLIGGTDDAVISTEFAYARVVEKATTTPLCSASVSGMTSAGVGNSIILPKGVTVQLAAKNRTSQNAAVKVYAVK